MFPRMLSDTVGVTCCLVVVGLSVATPRRALAETATPSEMAAVCRNWLSYIVHRQGDWAGEVAPRIQGAQDLRIDDVLIARCYSISPQGHVVIPVLKELPPIKAYSEDCGLDLNETDGFARLLREVMGTYARQYIEIHGSLDAVLPRDGPSPFGSAHRSQWDLFGIDPTAFSSQLGRVGQRPRSEVGPLLTTRWHQQAPYNNRCPMGDGGTCKVGCMATAVAQLMRYHQWPPTGLGGKTYYWWGDDSCGGSTEGWWIMGDFSDPYDWANMPDGCESSCTLDQENALAELCQEVGISLEMDYGYCGSGPMDDDLSVIMPTHFRYDPSIVREFRRNYTVEDWFALVQAEINANRPMVYYFQMYENGIGHAVVCDGWSDDGGELRYHVNYGWGGTYTGWYVVDQIHGTYDPMREVMDRHIMPGSGFVFQVRPDGLGTYANIQSAIDHVLDGDIIELTSGVFAGAGNRDIDFRGKAITVRSRGLDPTTCIVDCAGGPQEHRGFRFVSGEGPSSVLEGIAIVNGYVAGLNRGGGILCSGNSSPTIRNCMLRGNRAWDGGGGISCSASSPLIERCVFSQNSTDRTGGAISITDGAQPVITACTFSDNRSAVGGGAGIWTSSSSQITVENSILAWGQGGEAVRCDGGSPSPALRCCDLFGNSGGDWVGCVAGQLGSDGNISADPLFCDQAGGNFHIRPESPCNPEANPACGLIGAVAVGCRHLTVRPDGSGDFPTIQAAIDAAGESDFVELADGIYTGAGNRDLDFGGRRITIRSESGNPDSCTIDCQGTAEDPHRGFHFHSGEMSNSRLDGIGIANGHMTTYSGGAIWCANESSPLITNCVFSKNQSEASGGAVWCSAKAEPTFVNCGFFGNRAANGGAVFAMASRPAIRNCTFVGNGAGGGSAMFSTESDLVVANSILAFNTGAQPATCMNGSVSFSCCDIYGNEAGDWVGCAAGQEGANGNICLDPLFCDAAAGDYRLDDGSPCAPFSTQNPECDLVGAYPVGCAISSSDEDVAGRMSPYLAPGRPNPSANGTKIAYSLGSGWRTGTVRLSIISASGRLLRTLVDRDQAGGVHEVTWDGKDDRGRVVPAGVYFVQMRVNGERLARRIVLIH